MNQSTEEIALNKTRNLALEELTICGRMQSDKFEITMLREKFLDRDKSDARGARKRP